MKYPQTFSSSSASILKEGPEEYTQRQKLPSYTATQRLSDTATQIRSTTQIHSDLDSAAFIKATLSNLLSNGYQVNSLFEFARSLKTLKAIGQEISQEFLSSAFYQWWAIAGENLPGEIPERWLIDFMDMYRRAKHDTFQLALSRANSAPKPPACDQFTDPQLRELIAVLYHLQCIVGLDKDFAISVRQVAQIMRTDNSTKSLLSASRKLGGLEAIGIIVRTKKGAGRKASLFHYIA